ncbi:zinc finger BED domain-containing protein RICESLEEPER 2-like [Panicum hallii]|uniref:zinc finger BED domain-containing protein RICESLEEPER 2-like n=1 Tax=Panicum hallii TaxID=206008 RepID=UPI000DF4DAB6|nr:zinc finger BED domain-containing protein RICESLEEPER 2-like [Panicum hallii]
MDNSIKRVRAAVRFVKNGSSRLAKFKKLAEEENVETNAFLKLDVCTRWNSTYLMLNTAIMYEKVFVRYEEEDPAYTIELCGDKGLGIPVEYDWENAKKMAEFLGHFYDITLRVSSTLSVTANEFFHEIGEIQVLLRDWADSEDLLRQAMAKRMKDKYDKYWGSWHENENEFANEVRGKGRAKEKENMNLLIFVATALDPRYKLSSYTKLVILEMFGEEKGQKVWDAVNECFYALFEEYRNIYAPSDSLPNEVDEEPTQKRRGSLMRSVIAKKMKVGSASMGTTKSEIDKYLSEDNENDSKKFDILTWWKVNESRLPILARIARDVLAIPISTVASESVFSMDWLRRSTPINVDEDAEEIAKLEEELVVEYNAEKAAAKEGCKGSGKAQSSVSITKPSCSAVCVD